MDRFLHIGTVEVEGRFLDIFEGSWETEDIPEDRVLRSNMDEPIHEGGDEFEHAQYRRSGRY